MKRVVVVGGGITGLACASALRGRARVTLLEAGSRWGGQIATRRVQGHLVEGGAESLYGLGPELTDFLRGLGVDLIPASAGLSSVYHRGRLHPLPPGLARGAPDRPGAFLAGRLLSPAGKLRMGFDLLLPRGPTGRDVSLGEFLERRLGREARERIGEPLLAGIHLARADELSLQATYPGLAALEREHRSLFLGLRRQGAAAPAAPAQAPRGGMGELVSRLLDGMPEVDARCGAAVRRLQPMSPEASEPRWRIVLDGESLTADAVVLAVPANRAGPMLARDFRGLAAALASIRYRSCATVTLAFKGAPPFGATSLYLPAEFRHGLAACSVPSRRYAGRAPEGGWMVRCFLREALVDAAEAALEGLEEAVGPLGIPLFTEVQAWPLARPVYELGHLERVAEIERRTPPGLFLAGSAYRGGGVPDCIADARRAAARLLAS